jgi:hypothetical protein
MPLPLDLVTEMVRYRVAENQAKTLKKKWNGRWLVIFTQLQVMINLRQVVGRL